MLERILATLSQNGWQITTHSGEWVMALNEFESRGLAFVVLTEGLDLHPPLKHYANITNWDVLILCPEGLDSSLFKRVPPRTQFWFWDLEKGNIFASPATRDMTKRDWLMQVASGQYPEPNSEKRIEAMPLVTYLFIGVNLLLFLLMTVAGGSISSISSTVLIAFGAKVNQLIISGEIWRLLTSNFLHIGFFHLAFNLYALWMIGPFAEGLFGHKAYVGLYLLSGIGGNLASFIFSPALSAGASASIFGLLGALLYYSWRHPHLWRSGLGMNLLVVVAVNLGFGFVQTGIDNYAHLGGLLTGFIFSAGFHRFYGRLQ
ncbi:MAG: rhomboid family intramembrane serine protease [Desulfitobacteriaceae bacterium]